MEPLHGRRFTLLQAKTCQQYEARDYECNAFRTCMNCDPSADGNKGLRAKDGCYAARRYGKWFLREYGTISMAQVEAEIGQVGGVIQGLQVEAEVGQVGGVVVQWHRDRRTTGTGIVALVSQNHQASDYSYLVLLRSRCR